MPTFYNFVENGVTYSFDDIFVPADLFRDGALWLWGFNSSGQLGTNDLNNRSTPVTTFAGGTNWKQVSGGYGHTAAIKTDGTLWTWGSNSLGRLGTNDLNNRSTPVTTFAGGTNWKQVSVANGHTAAIKTDGTLWTWGSGGSGELGRISANSFRLTPVTTFAGGTNWADTASGAEDELYTISGSSFTTAIKTDGTLWIWGNGTYGRLGTNDLTNRSTPVTTFAGGSNWKQLSGGSQHTAAIKTDGTLWTWGYGSFGRLGTNDLITRSTPVTTFAGGANWKQVSVGNFHTTAIKTDGTLWTWGFGSDGQLGTNDAITRSIPVTTFAGGTNWKQVSGGGRYTAAIKTDGTLWTWGFGSDGQLGRATGTSYRATPVTTFAGGTNWTDTATGAEDELYTISAGGLHTTAIKTDGTLWIWGNGTYGRLGTNDLNNRSTPVTTFAGGTNWKQVSGGYRHTAAIKTDGTLWTWGNGTSGQLGTNDTITRSTPVTTFTGGTDWKQVSVSGFISQYTAAIKTDGTLWTWGTGTSGQLGTNDLITRSTPVTTFAGGTNWKQVSAGAGGSHTAAIKTDGTLWTWGSGAYGRLGTNDTITRSTPVTTFAGGTDWKQVSVGNRHTAAIKTDGTLWTWGNGTSGQLGTNDTITRSTPVTTFAGGTNWKQVSAGNSHTTAIKTDGTLWTWGYGSNGRLGTNDITQKNTPVTTFVGGTNWKQVSAGNSHTVALRDDGINKELYAFGSNFSLQLGNLLVSLNQIADEVGGTDWKQVSAGNSHTAAIKTDGTLWTWGSGVFGTLGNNTNVTNVFTPVTTFAGGTNWKQVSAGAGGSHTAAIKTDGTLWTWGSGSYGRLGTNDTITRSTPVTTFVGGTNWKQVSAGSFHTVALRDDGVNKELYAFGSNSTLQLGTLFANTSQIPDEVGGTNWKQVSSSGSHAAAIKTDGTLWTWGYGGSGQLGTNDTSSRNTPVTTFVGGTNWKQVSGGGGHTAAIKTDGTLWTWGLNTFGRLGRISANSLRLTPVTTFAGGTNWADTTTGAEDELYTMSSGDRHTTAIKTDGTLWTWGTGTSGQLGTNDTITRSTPVTTFTGGTDWKQVSAGVGGQYIAAIKTDGTLWTWGAGTSGQLGNNNTVNISTPVTTFTGGTNWKQVSAGSNHTAAIKTDGTLWIWGNGTYGQLGTNNIINRSTPVTTFAGGTNWKQVSGGYRHTAAIKTDGTLWTWGNGTSGQLGTNDTITRSTPVTTFAGGTNWKQVSAGTFFTAAIKTDGTLWTWGSGSDGQLGRLSINSYRITPVTTFAGGTNWADTATGAEDELFTISTGSAIKTDGTLWLWGLNDGGQLGINDLINRSTPVTTFAGGSNWKQVAVGGANASMAIKNDGTLWTWGFTSTLLLGRLNAFNLRAIPVTTFAGGTNWADTASGAEDELYTISGSNSYTTAIKTDGTLWTWGLNTSGQLGTNDITNRSTPVTTFAGGSNWKQLSGGSQHTAAIKTDGTLWTWGVNSSGELGRLTAFNLRAIPVTTFAGGTNWADTTTGAEDELYTISAGLQHTAAIKTDGTLWTWGYGSNGRLGTNDITQKNTPVTTFAGGTNWKQISSGNQHTAAIKTDGTLWTWGDTGSGRLGTNDLITRSTPVTTFAGGTDWKQVSCGNQHTAAIKTDGTLWTWGYGSSGRLGTNDINNRRTPVTTFAGGTNWKQVSAGNGHTAAIKTDGTLWTWGPGGALGTNDASNRSTPVTTFAGGTNWKQISSGNQHTAAIKTDGTLWTWGAGFYGRLGTNDTIGRNTPVTTFAGGTDWKQVSAGTFFTAAIKTDGTLWTWGNGTSGQLGTNDTITRSTPVTTFTGGTNWKQVSAGSFHTVALRDDGINKELYVFGNNANLQLGTLFANTSQIPDEVGGTNWKQVSGGFQQTAAIKTDGTLWTWGNGNQGQLGNNVLSTIATPVTTFAGGTNWKQVSVGFQQTAAIKTDGTLWTWGSGSYGRLGTNDTITRNTPVTTFAGGTDWKQVSCGYRCAVAIKTDGTLWTWGFGGFGALGNNNVINRSTPVTTFAGGTNWKQVSVSSVNQHIAAIKTDGTLWTWGNGGSGQLGTNDVIIRSTPVTTFAGGTNWKQVNAGIQHTVALRDDGINKELYVFGNNANLQLGTLFANTSQIPDEVGGTNWKQVSTSGSHAAAIKTDGTLWTWGNGGSGQLGNGGATSSSTPVTTSAGGTNWKQVDTGSFYTVAIKTDGTLWSWGIGGSGQHGTNDIISRLTPVTTFAGGTNWKQVSAGNSHTAAIKTDGTLWLWGFNGSGQLGTNDLNNRSTPVTTFAGGTNWKQISSGNQHTAAIKTDGTLWTWGLNTSGQLGTNDLITRSTPVTTFAGGTNWTQVFSGENSVAVLRDDGINKELYVFGNNFNLQLGTLFANTSQIPDEVGGTNWKQVSGGRHTAAIKTDGTLWTWGNGTSGQLGTNDTTVKNTPVTTFAGGTNWKQVSAVNSHTVALRDDGINKELYVFGNNANLQLGNLVANTSQIPDEVGGTNWKQVSGGSQHTAAIKTDGTLWTWGNGGSGQLGNNNTFNISTPVTTFTGGTNWKQVSGGGRYTAAIKTDGTLWIWGNGTYGQLGTNNIINRSTPVTTFAGGSNWKQLSGGLNHMAALTYSDSVI